MFVRRFNIFFPKAFGWPQSVILLETRNIAFQPESTLPKDEFSCHCDSRHWSVSSVVWSSKGTVTEVTRPVLGAGAVQASPTALPMTFLWHFITTFPVHPRSYTDKNNQVFQTVLLRHSSHCVFWKFQILKSWQGRGREVGRRTKVAHDLTWTFGAGQWWITRMFAASMSKYRCLNTFQSLRKVSFYSHWCQFACCLPRTFSSGNLLASAGLGYVVTQQSLFFSLLVSCHRAGYLILQSLVCLVVKWSGYGDTIHQRKEQAFGRIL